MQILSTANSPMGFRDESNSNGISVNSKLACFLELMFTPCGMQTTVCADHLRYMLQHLPADDCPLEEQP